MTAPGPAGALAAAVLVPGAESAAALAALVREAMAAGVEREVLHIRLGAFAAEIPRGGHHERLVLEALAPLLRPSRARLFALPNGDLVAAAPPGGHHTRAVAARIATLLGGAEEAEGGPGRWPPLAAFLRLPEQSLALMVALEAAVSPAPALGAARPAAAAASPPPSSAEAAMLERALANASVSSFLRWQPVVRLAPPGAEAAEEGPRTQWTEWRLALPALCATLLQGRDIDAAPALARRLRGLLDRRLLAELSRPEEARKLGDAGIGIGLAALSAPEFRRFDEALGQPGRARVLLCLPAEEVLADAEGFLAARAVCARRGFRLALELPDAAGLPMLAGLDRLGVDHLRLPYAPGLPTEPAARLPAGRVVLTGADRAAAIAWGWEAGITLFEGRMLRG